MHDRDAAMEFLIRGGRGISYHEFALSIMDPEKYRYQKILRKAGPKIHQAFYEELLSFAIIKD